MFFFHLKAVLDPAGMPKPEMEKSASSASKRSSPSA
jgi:hypothetical protein